MRGVRGMHAGARATSRGPKQLHAWVNMSCLHEQYAVTGLDVRRLRRQHDACVQSNATCGPSPVNNPRHSAECADPIKFEVDIFWLWFIRCMLADLRVHHPELQWREERVDWFGKLFTVDVSPINRESVQRAIELAYLNRGFIVY